MSAYETFMDGAKKAHALWISWLMDGVKAMERGDMVYADKCFHEADKAKERGLDYEMRASWYATNMVP